MAGLSTDIAEIEQIYAQKQALCTNLRQAQYVQQRLVELKRTIDDQFGPFKTKQLGAFDHRVITDQIKRDETDVRVLDSLISTYCYGVSP